MDVHFRNTEYQEFLEGCYQHPVLLIEITSMCNFRCEYCLSRLKTRKKCFMQPDLFEHIIEQVPDITDSPVRLHVDGEPTLHPHFLTYARMLNKKSIPFGLATNGSLLSPNFLDLKMEMILSLSTSEEEFKRRSKTIDYKSYLATVGDYFRQWAASSSEQTIFVQIPVDPHLENESYMARKREFVKNLIAEMGGAGSGITVEERSACDVWLIKPNGSIMRFYYWHICNTANYRDPSPEDKRIREGFCSMPWQEMTILADGRVGFCCSDLTGGTAFTDEPDIRNRSLLELWRDTRIVNIRKKFQKREIALDVCQRCLATIPRHEFYGTDHPFEREFQPKDKKLFPVDSVGTSRGKTQTKPPRKRIWPSGALFRGTWRVPDYTGWWFDPDQPGSGVSIEVRNQVLFLAVCTYDDQSGNPVWYYSGGAMSDRSHYRGNLISPGRRTAENADGPNQPSTVGAIDLAFTSRNEATIQCASGSGRREKRLVRFLDFVASDQVGA